MAGLRQTAAAWLAKWNIAFANNEFRRIVEGTFRDLFADIAATYVSYKALNIKDVKGATYPVPFTDSLDLIPAEKRILNMKAVARVGLSAADAAAAGEAAYGNFPEVVFQLLRDSAGDINALLDEEENTVATVKAGWVQVSGLPAAIVDSFPPFVPEDRTPTYKAGDRFRYTFPSGEKRLFEVQVDIPTYVNPVPTGADNDPNYAPYAPLITASSYDDTALQAAVALKADLVGGKVPASQLPSYVDDVIESATLAALPAVGETGKLYNVTDNAPDPTKNGLHRWTGTAYVMLPVGSALAQNLVDGLTAAQNPATVNPFITQTRLDTGLVTRVATAASITSGGVTTTYATAQEATNNSALGVPVILRGAQGPLNLYASETIDAATANFGSNQLQVGFPPGGTAHNTRISGFSHAGRIVLIPQITGAGNVYTLEDVNISGAGRIEVFLLNSGAFQGAKDTVNLTRIRGTKTVVSAAGTDSLATALIIFQGRSDFNQRQLIINERDCDLTNEVGAIYGGYITRGSIINRLGNSRAVPAAGFAFQVVTSIDAGAHVPLTDAEIISDQRTASGGGGISTLVIESISALRVSKGFPILDAVTSFSAVLDLNASGATFQLDKATKPGATRVVGPPDQTAAQMLTALQTLTSADRAETPRLYVKVVPVVAADPATVLIRI